MKLACVQLLALALATCALQAPRLSLRRPPLGTAGAQARSAPLRRMSELDWDTKAAQPGDGNNEEADPEVSRFARIQAKWAERNEQLATNWKQDSWSGHAIVLCGADIRTVALRKGVTTFGTEEGTLYTVRLGSERLAQFHRLGRFEHSGGYVGKLPDGDDTNGTIFRDLTVGLDAEENRRAGNEPFRFMAQYAAHDGPVNAVVWAGPLLVSGGADGTLRVLTNRAHRRGRLDETERLLSIEAFEPIVGENGQAGLEGEDDFEQEQELYNPMNPDEELIGEDEERRVPVFTMRADENREHQPCGVVALATFARPALAEADDKADEQGDGSAGELLVASVTEGGCLRLFDPVAGVAVGRPAVVTEVEDPTAPITVTSMSVLENTGVVAVGTSQGRVSLFSIAELLQPAPETTPDAESPAEAEVAPAVAAVAPMLDAEADDVLVNEMEPRRVVADRGVPPLHTIRVMDNGAVTALASRSSLEEGEEGEGLAQAWASTDVLICGTSLGEVLQYEIFNDRHSHQVRHWPQLRKQQTRERFHAIQPHLGPITSLFTDGVSIVSTCAQDGEIKAHDARLGHQFFRLGGFEDGLTGCGVDYDAGLIVCDGRASLLSVHNFEKPLEM